jgi:hypothetical protein
MTRHTEISICFFDDREVRAGWDETNNKTVDISAKQEEVNEL